MIRPSFGDGKSFHIDSKKNKYKLINWELENKLKIIYTGKNGRGIEEVFQDDLPKVEENNNDGDKKSDLLPMVEIETKEMLITRNRYLRRRRNLNIRCHAEERIFLERGNIQLNRDSISYAGTYESDWRKKFQKSLGKLWACWSF